MGTDYVVFYTEASLVCILILSMLLTHDWRHSTKQESQICFNRAVVSFILYFISDAFWAAVLGGVLPKTRFLTVLFNLSNYILLGVMAFEWFMFMAASEKMRFRRSRKKKALCLSPLAVSVPAISAAYTVNPRFWINDNCDVNDLYYPMMIAVPALYLLTAFFLSMVNARKAETREEKRQYWLIGSIPLGVMGFGLLQVSSMNAPMFCFGCTIMLLYFYIQHMQTLISVDALTRLNNRGQINRYLEQVTYRENATISVMMIDIDRFKEINDTYGHAEGDRALVLVSEALKIVCERIKAPIFLGRYGGDEFTLIIQDPGENDGYPAQIAEGLRAALAEKHRENQLPYELEVSIGYDELRDKSDTLKDCLVRADEKLYEEKAAKGAAR